MRPECVERAEALGKTGEADVIPQLGRMMYDIHGYVCRAAVECIRKNRRSVVLYLISALRSENTMSSKRPNRH